VLLGVVLVSGLAGGGAVGPRPAAGLAYAVATSVAFTFFLLIMRKAGGTTGYAAGQLLDVTAGATAGGLLLGLALGGLRLAVPWPSLGWLALLAVSCQVTGWLLITASLPRLPASVSSLLLLVQPAAALILAAVILGQRPTLIQVGGAVLVCCGVLVVARPRREAGASAGEPVAGEPVPGGAVPGEPVPGGAAPGGAAPGGSVPGGSVPGGAVAGGAAP